MLVPPWRLCLALLLALGLARGLAVAAELPRLAVVPRVLEVTLHPPRVVGREPAPLARAFVLHGSLHPSQTQHRVMNEAEKISDQVELVK